MKKVCCDTCYWYHLSGNGEHEYCMYLPPERIECPTYKPITSAMDRCHHHSDLEPVKRCKQKK
jgi:hypothetical protein